MNSFKISVLIPSWNGADYIEDCVQSILNNDYENYEIFLVLGGNDKSYEIAQLLETKNKEKLTVLKRKECSKNEALNMGLERAQGDIIVITDVDCIYQKDWLKKINEIFKDDKINVITSLNLPYSHISNSLAEFNRIKVGYNLIKYENGEIVNGAKLWGGNSAFRATVFKKKIGKFRDISRTGEDKLLGMELNRKGEDLYFFRNIFVYTEHYSDNLKKFINQRVRWARDLFIDFKKKDILKVLVLLGIGFFKFLYPIGALFIWLLFFNTSILALPILLSPWFLFYVIFMLNLYIELKRKSKEVNKELNKNFDYKKAFKIVPIMFFIYGIINLKAYLNLKSEKWYHQ